MSARRRKVRRKWSVGRVVALVIGVIGSTIAFAPVADLIPGLEAIVWRWLVFWSIFWVAIALHELGHAIVGKALGMTILRFYVIPLEIRLRPLSFHFARRVFGRDLGGAVVFVNAPYASRRDRVLLSLAGPGANFLTAAILIAFATAAPGVAPEIVASMVWISLTLGIANLVPFDTSDGAMILTALRRRPASPVR